METSFRQTNRPRDDPEPFLCAAHERRSEEVEKLAAGVNELMLAIASKAPNADSTHIAVLACLHLADRLRELERDLATLQDRVDRKSTEFADMLEQLIASAGETPAGER